MFRRLISTVVLIAGVGVYALAAQERATFILTSGERKSGKIVFHTNTRENLIDGDLNLGTDDGREMQIHVNQVAVIDFVGGRPGTPELAQLGSGQLLVMRDGTSQPGRFINMIGGDTLIWENQDRQTQRYPIRDVSRVYLNPESARTAYRYRGPSGIAATTEAPAPANAVRVNANQAWTDTGVTVRRGDRVVFQATGEIRFGQTSGQTSTVDGNPAERNANYPFPSAPVGALLGKIGNSPPFGIGSQTQPLVMPASGRLMLGINDSELGDNSGFFSVVVTNLSVRK